MNKEINRNAFIQQKKWQNKKFDLISIKKNGMQQLNFCKNISKNKIKNINMSLITNLRWDGCL